jgi:hypothetical protein
LSKTLSQKPATFGSLRRLKKNVGRGLRIEHGLIALLIAFAALQAYFIFGAKGT